MFLSVYGHFNMDIILRVERIPVEGSIPVENTLNRPGGTARNIAYAARLLGLSVELFSRIGDGFPRDFVNQIKNRGVDTRNLRVVKGYGFTPVCFIVSDGKRQLAFIDQGPMGRMMDYENLPKGRWVHFSTGIPEEYIKIKRMVNSRISIDPGQEIHYRYNEKNLAEMLEGTDFFFVNEIEYERALELIDEDMILEKTKNVIVTLGERGCRIINSSGKMELPSYRVKAKESVGAGDSFRAGFYAGLKNKLDIKQSCKLGMKVASIVVSSGGIPEKMPDVKELIRSL
ncbi:MAG: carbohydrate kinase family protein [Thermoplasmata archaeon]|jgi:6-phosphofructokinase 1/ribokinase|nr:carbohydrate kinase family protein [Thermoplasmatales archaeon]PMP74611.1 MAG: hypothetical protein C0180_03700 [Aciduliprofundum sp.]HEU12956.1 carbohydrate kinase family protein [Euryarchaeota archaeon]